MRECNMRDSAPCYSREDDVPRRVAARLACPFRDLLLLSDRIRRFIHFVARSSLLLVFLTLCHVIL